ncbi:MAG: hypothetical protein KHX06_01345, partial [Brachyspira sp.]|nr:hypothetical protein [Brachyspira sp.]
IVNGTIRVALWESRKLPGIYYIFNPNRFYLLGFIFNIKKFNKKMLDLFLRYCIILTMLKKKLNTKNNKFCSSSAQLSSAQLSSAQLSSAQLSSASF